ncbi:PIN domain-containing protein [Nesterenkonia sp. DZ6]|uniref:PIN domain-containing protein n=1 Tax=Nesterenkonia sp. DZ6 TaxID=2901229 RepID=UPI001F4C57F6|nr:PIN domain-containing protein [Nesterenkonia sp. DZ6]MCH8560292.1 PIN domain-containing protein [Nesterenkonia sp. DZ6]
MKPLVFLDTTALYGTGGFTSSAVKQVFALSSARLVHLVVPDVVILELGRQWKKSFDQKRLKLMNATSGFNMVTQMAGAQNVAVVPPDLDSTDFYRGMKRRLLKESVEIATYSKLSIEDLLSRDLEGRKPFSESGRGFRDALIWESIRTYCSTSGHASGPAIFVTANHTDFCEEQGGPLHSELRSELKGSQGLEVVDSLQSLLSHQKIRPLAEILRVVDKTLTDARLSELLDRALEQLQGLDVEATLGLYDGDGLITNPIETVLDGPSFAEIVMDDATIEFHTFDAGEPGTTTIRVTVEADCVLEGYIYKSDVSLYELDSVAILGDWSSHMLQATETRRVQFTLGTDFPTGRIEDGMLAVEVVEDITDA